MSYVETSAAVAILLEEPGSEALLAQIHAAETRVTSVVSKIEMAISIGRAIKNYPRAAQLVDEFLHKSGVGVIAVPAEIYPDVIQAYTRYGKGTGHPAQLNFGDCFSYAIAKARSEVIIYKGDDFSRTDLTTG